MLILFENGLIQFGWLGLLGGLLAAAVWHDVKSYRIPNMIVFPGTALALLLHACVPSGVSFMGMLGEVGLLQALGGLALGLASLLPLYLIRAAGAGDVKLMAMVGAFLGPNDALGAVLSTYILGALLALTCAWRIRVLSRMAHNLQVIVCSVFARLAAASGPSFDSSTETAAKMPYSIAIATGTATWIVLRHFA